MANGATIQYTGTAQAVNLSTPLWLQEDPRNTGIPELFAVVNDSSSAQITAYAKNETNGINYFTKSGQSSPVPFNNIVTTLVTDMDMLFYNIRTFNYNISSWDTSKVTTMRTMFSLATIFSGNLSKWDTSKVTIMDRMFQFASKFNSDISGWNVSSVTNMYGMFENASIFLQNLNGWNIAKVTNRINFATSSPLALSANSGKQPIWPALLSRLANGKTIRYTGSPPSTNPFFIQEDPRNTGTPEWFAVVGGSQSDENTPIKNYAKSANSAVSTYFTPPGEISPVLFNNIVTTRLFGGYMRSMFADAYTFDKDISSWDLSNITNTSLMFYNARAFNQDISKWDMSNIDNISYMFHGTQAFNRDIGVWNVAKVSYMDGVFRYATAFNKNLSGWDVNRSGISRNDFALGSQLELAINSGKLPLFQ